MGMLVSACVNGNTAMTIRDDCHGFLSLLDTITEGLVGEYDSHNVPDNGKIDVRSIIQRSLETVTNVTFTIESIDAKVSVKWLKGNGLH